MEPSILKKSIKHIDLPEEIKIFMQKHHIDTLEKLLGITGAELLDMDGFSYRMLQQLLSFLHDHNGLHLFKEN